MPLRTPIPSRVAWAAVAALVALPSCSSGRADPASGEDDRDGRVSRRSVEDVFLLTGELAAVRSTSIVTPRGRGPLQIRWLAEDGAEVNEGDPLVDFDASNLIQTIEERRLQLEQAVIRREAAERNAAAEAEKKRVAVEKAEVEAEKARIDAEVPREMRPAAEWRKFQATWHEKRAALEKARLEKEAYGATSRAEIETARATEHKARRELAEFERSLASHVASGPPARHLPPRQLLALGPRGAPQAAARGSGLAVFSPSGRIPDPGAMEVQAVADRGLTTGRSSPGMRVRCILDTYPDRVFDGEK